MNYYVKKMCTQQLSLEAKVKKGLLDFFTPQTHNSHEYKNWISTLSPTTCVFCINQHGKVYSIYEIPDVEPPVHDRCGCKITPMKSVHLGDATKDGRNGVDLYVNTYGLLPSNYITKKEAKKAGWVNVLGNLSLVAPGKVIGGDIYKNRNKHLPSSPGRIWYEADINYDNGYRNGHRLIYSNDGLIFATYDHYMTFVEIH